MYRRNVNIFVSACVGPDGQPLTVMCWLTPLFTSPDTHCKGVAYVTGCCTTGYSVSPLRWLLWEGGRGVSVFSPLIR